MTPLIKSGLGWRVGWDPNAPQYPALVGTDDWAIELTAAELADFCRLTDRLVATLETLATELMDEEAITCELECDRLWVEAEGFPHAYRLRLILQEGRRAEATWTAAATPELLQALRTLQVF
ncbi:MAG: DUF1818 family protein [Synechococcales bacterium]|nr:DUF1818 family protein [Synechococcales bacterium]